MRLVRIGLFALVGTVALSALAQTIEGQDVDAIRKRSAEMKADAEALVDHVKDRGVRFREEAGIITFVSKCKNVKTIWKLGELIFIY